MQGADTWKHRIKERRRKFFITMFGLIAHARSLHRTRHEFEELVAQFAAFRDEDVLHYEDGDPLFPGIDPRTKAGMRCRAALEVCPLNALYVPAGHGVCVVVFGQ